MAATDPGLRLKKPFVVLVAATLWLSHAAHAQEDEWKRLYTQAITLDRQGNFRQAAIVAAQAVDVAERTFGREHYFVATTLNELGLSLYHEGQYGQAEPVFKRALAIREKALPSLHPAVAQSLNSLALLYATQGRHAQALPLYQRALETYEKTLGTENRAFAETLNNLASLYHDQGKYAQSEPLYQRAIAINEKVRGPESPEVATNLANLGNVYAAQGKYAQAETLHLRDLAIREKTRDAWSPDVAIALNNLAELARTRSRYEQAEPLYLRAIAIQEKAFGPEHPELARVLNNLGFLYLAQGRYVDAEPLFRRALAIREKTLGPGDPALSWTLTHLAMLYHTQDRPALAEPLYTRALAISESALGPEHPHLAMTLTPLAQLYAERGEYARAEPLYRRALAINEKTYGAVHGAVALSLHQLASLYSSQGKYAVAEPIARRSLDIYEKSIGEESHAVAVSLNHLAQVSLGERRYAQAEALFKRSLAIKDKALGPDHPALAQGLSGLAATYYAEGEVAQALATARRASLIYRNRIVAGGVGDEGVREASQFGSGFGNHLVFLSANPGNEPPDRIADEALQIVQLTQASGTASAIAKMAARFATGDDALAGLVKRKQDATDRLARGEAQLVGAAGKAPQERDRAEEERTRGDIARARKEMEIVDAELNRRFPEYQQLTRPEPLPAARVRELLRPREAMLVYALDSRSFMWVITRDDASYLPLQVDASAVARNIAAIRDQMELDGQNHLQRVNLGALHDLYRSVFAPALPRLQGVRHVIVVAGGALQSLPFSMLVASPPPQIKSPADYRQVDWLARHYAVSVLPSVSSIQALRQFAKPANDQEPFAGFGDPLIGTPGAATRGKQARTDVATLFRNAQLGGNVVDVEAIRQAPRLPETAAELRSMATALKAGDGALWLQERATESNVKRLDMSRYRTVAFATHGVMAGDIKGVGEPGLILTPPRKGSAEDDGYLSASEIARLKLNADWVVLSACNTAAADGTPGAEGLSGLAKAFFYAGARSLLVSHWPVASEATVPLTTGMLKEWEAHPGQGKAEAHRKAMLQLMDAPNPVNYAHPLFWAPFMVVGEGGATR